MRTFTPQQNPPQERVSSSLARSSTATSGSIDHTRPILNLHRRIGNQAVQRLPHANAEEREAYSATTALTGSAYDFSQIPLYPKAPTGPSLVQRKCASCAEEDEDDLKVQRKQEDDGGEESRTAPALVGEVVAAGGRPLDAQTRGFFEPRFGRDLGDVRIHTDGRADASARAVDALAYTVGRDVVFRRDAYAPETAQGKWLLAHELAHVLQQPQKPADYGSPAKLQVGAASDAAEVEADRAADMVMRGAGAPSMNARSEVSTLRRFPGCSSGQNSFITEGLRRARIRMPQAASAVAEFVAGTNTRAQAPVRRHFGALSPPQLGTVNTRLAAAATYLGSDAHWQCDTAATYAHCGPPDNWCAGTGCPGGATTHLCPQFFPGSGWRCVEPSETITLIHEALRSAGVCGGIRPPGARTPPGSLDNIFSYSRLIYAISSSHAELEPGETSSAVASNEGAGGSAQEVEQDEVEA